MDFNDLVVRLISAIKRRRALFYLLFVCVFLGAVGGAYVKPAKFESTAKMLVSMESSRVKSTAADQKQILTSLAAEELMAAQVEIMRAREVTEELVDTLPEWVFAPEPSNKWYVRLIIDPLNDAIEFVKQQLVRVQLIDPDNERYSRIETIEKGLTVFPVRKAQVIEVSFQSRYRDVPPLVVEQLIEIYKKRSKQLRSESEGYELYHQRALRLSEELAKAERERTAFLMEHNIIDFESERQQLIERLQVQRLKADEERLMQLVALEPQLNLLNRNASILAESYFVYRKAADDRQTFFERDNEISAQLIDAPSVVYKKYTRSRLTLVLMGLAAAIALSIIIVLLVEWIVGIRQVYASVGFRKHERDDPEADHQVKAAE